MATRAKIFHLLYLFFLAFSGVSDYIEWLACIYKKYRKQYKNLKFYVNTMETIPEYDNIVILQNCFVLSCDFMNILFIFLEKLFIGEGNM